MLILVLGLQFLDLAVAFFTPTPRRVLLNARRSQWLLKTSGGDPGEHKKPSNTGDTFLRNALQKNVMFSSMPTSSLNTLIDAFELVEVDQDQVLVEQGDSSEGGFVFVIAEGKCTVTVDGKVVPEPYGVLQPQSIIGELG